MPSYALGYAYPSKQNVIQHVWLGNKTMRDRGEQSPAPAHLLAATKTREVQVRADSTVLVASEPQVGAMRCYHPAEAPLTASEYTSKTQMSQRYHAYRTTAMPAHKNNSLTSCTNGRYLSWTYKQCNESSTNWPATWNSIHCVWLTDPSSVTITSQNIFVLLWSSYAPNKLGFVNSYVTN